MNDGGQDPDLRQAVRGMGQRLGPETLQACVQLFREEQLARIAPGDRVADLPYGSAPRQKLDLYRPASATGSGSAVLLWVHGGGFVRGVKHSLDHPFNAHIGRFAARHGLLGAVMNYRLAPEHRYPSGGEDVGLAVDWLLREALAHGGDPTRIFAAGTSAGAVHVATHLALRAGREGLRGAALFSGLYGATALEPPDLEYYGDTMGEGRGPDVLEALAATRVPLFVACAEFDPPRFQSETMALLQRRLELTGRLPRAYFAGGHNHYSLAMHIGGRDQRLARELLSFIAETSHDPPTG